MARRQYISTQDVVLTLPCPQGLPSSATVALTHPTDADLDVAAASITLPTATATVDVAASPHAQAISVGAGHTLTAVGREYLLTFPDGRTRVAEVDGVSATSVHLAAQMGLPETIPVGTTISDHVLSHDAGTLAKATAWRATWALSTPDSVETTTFDVVSQIFRLDLTLDDLEAMAPGITRLGAVEWPKLLRGATRYFSAWLARRGLDPGRVRDTGAFESAALTWILHTLSRHKVVGGWFDERQLVRLDKDLEREMRDLDRARYWYDADDDGRRDDTEPGRETGRTALSAFPFTSAANAAAAAAARESSS